MNRLFSSVLVSPLQNINRHFIVITIKDTPAKTHTNFGIFTPFSLRTADVGWKEPHEVTYSNLLLEAGTRLLRVLSSWLWKSPRDVLLRNLVQCLTALRVKKVFFMSSWTILCFSWWPLSLVSVVKSLALFCSVSLKEETKELHRETSSGI